MATDSNSGVPSQTNYNLVSDYYDPSALNTLSTYTGAGCTVIAPAAGPPPQPGNASTSAKVMKPITIVFDTEILLGRCGLDTHADVRRMRIAWMMINLPQPISLSPQEK